MNEEGIYNLINAIIERAANDYRSALRGRRPVPNKTSEDTVRECEQFFRSGWFEMMTNVDGEYLIQKIKGGRK